MSSLWFMIPIGGIIMMLLITVIYNMKYTIKKDRVVPSDREIICMIREYTWWAYNDHTKNQMIKIFKNAKRGIDEWRVLWDAHIGAPDIEFYNDKGRGYSHNTYPEADLYIALYPITTSSEILSIVVKIRFKYVVAWKITDSMEIIQDRKPLVGQDFTSHSNDILSIGDDEELDAESSGVGLEKGN